MEEYSKSPSTMVSAPLPQLQLSDEIKAAYLHQPIPWAKGLYADAVINRPVDHAGESADLQQPDW